MGMEEEKEVAVTPSTEDVVQALLDYFVEPVLPPKRFFETLSLDQQLSVAKQVHAVVLLYNYYQRKLQPHLQFLNWVSFCKLVVVLKPALMPFMKLMHQSDYSQLDDQENQLSPTEKAIIDACDFCTILEASKCIPAIEGWPITKVAVLVIDSSMENCLLLNSTARQRVWSVIEKDLDISNIRSEGTVGPKYKHKKRRTFKQPQRYNQSIDASGLQQLALLAVKEVAGINPNNLKVLESHVVYSLSEERASACFYVMQCIQSTGQGFQVPIKDVVTRLQGPVVKKTSNGWKASSVAEYFQLLPYAGIFSDLISRALLVHSSHAYQATYSPNRVDALNDGENGSLLHGSQNKDKSLSFENVVEIHQQMTNASSDSSNSKQKMEISDAIKSNGNVFIDGKVAGIFSQGPISSPPNEILGAKDVEKLLTVLASKEAAISETALRVLLQKREEMDHQQRVLEDKIALCSRDIIINGETNIQGETHQQGEAQRTIHCSRGNGLSNAILTLQSPCQELDRICHVNKWRLPR